MLRSERGGCVALATAISMKALACFLAILSPAHAARSERLGFPDLGDSKLETDSSGALQHQTALVTNSTLLEVFTAAQEARLRDSGARAREVYGNFSTIAIGGLTKSKAPVLDKLVEDDPTSELWQDDVPEGDEVEVMVETPKVESWLSNLEHNGLQARVNVPNVGEQLEEADLQNIKAFSKKAKGDIVGVYPTLEEVAAWMEHLVSQYPELLKIVSFGRTSEGRPMYLLRYRQKTDLPIVYVEGGMHAREWISVASVVWIVDAILHPSDESVRRLASSFEWHFLIVANPDGYKFSHERERLWRKNRARHPSPYSRCRGVDLNRNWDYLWGTVGISMNPCSDIYPGKAAFSEPESRAIRDHIARYRTSTGNRIKVYFQFHAFMQVVLIPPGAGRPPSDYQQLYEMGLKASIRMGKLFHRQYRVGSVLDMITKSGCSGSAMDWIHDMGHIKYTFVPELRPEMDRGRLGFSLPPEEIGEASQEAWAAVKYVARKALEEYEKGEI